MFTRISFENYRAFSKGSLRIAPITILVGANSIGKSSIMQIPLLFKQTLEQTDIKYKAALKIHGKDVSFGSARQVLHQQDTEKTIHFRYDFIDQDLRNSTQKGVSERIFDIQDDILQYFLYMSRSSGSSAPSHLSSRIAKIYETSHTSRSRNIESQLISEIIKYIGTRKSDRDVLLRSHFRPFGDMGSITVTDFELSRSFALALKEIRSPSFSVLYSLRYSEVDGSSVLLLDRFELRNEKKLILSISYDKDAEIVIESEFINRQIPKYIRSAISEEIDFGRTVFNFHMESKSKKSYIFQYLFTLVLSRALTTFSSQFSSSSISHIGPLRAYPRRFYFLDVAQPGSSEGELMIEALRENVDLRDQVNKWLKKFGINVSVSQFQEIIYRLSIRSTDNPFEMDITDVGFGISQILPILVEGFLSPLSKTILIEQPEIHLHPKMQAHLADLLIDIANINDNSTDKRRYIIVETHSEYLLNRLRSRIYSREISNADVAIHNIEKKDGKATVRGIYVPEDGSFEWPSEFLEADLNDTMIFLGAKS